jgi:hypothetical protein
MIYIKEFKNLNNKKGVLLNAFLTDYYDAEWEYKVNKLKKIINNLPNMVSPSIGHYKGLGFQTILDTDMKNAKTLAENISENFKESTIVLSEIEFDYKENIPVGHYQDSSFVKPGRFFDKLIKDKKIGIYII